ncbi:MAG: hypothetical protein GEU94_02220 [Micromonosporaceae bacterium]|nr:hypothetical protein [Micromonosporaceae bacterium]
MSYRWTGGPVGRPRLVPQSVVDRIYLMREAQHLPFRAIARALDADGIPSPLGLPTWQASTVRRIHSRTHQRQAS